MSTHPHNDGPSENSEALYNEKTDGPVVDRPARKTPRPTRSETAEGLAKLKAYANEHIPDFYDFGYSTENEALFAEQFRTLVDYVRPLVDQLPLEKLISELAATDAFRGGLRGFEKYLANEIMLLGTVGTLFHAANKADSFPPKTD